MLRRFREWLDTYKERLVTCAYVSLLCGALGCTFAAFLPFWIKLEPGKYLGVFTLIEDFHPEITWIKKRIFRPPKVNNPRLEWATDYYEAPNYLFGIGLALCLANVIVSSVQVCCLKSTSYRLCFISACLGLLSVALISLTMIFFHMNVEYQKSWTFMLAFISTLFVLLASILYLLAGRKNYLYSRMPSMWPDEVI